MCATAITVYDDDLAVARSRLLNFFAPGRDPSKFAITVKENRSRNKISPEPSPRPPFPFDSYV